MREWWWGDEEGARERESEGEEERETGRWLRERGEGGEERGMCWLPSVGKGVKNSQNNSEQWPCVGLEVRVRMVCWTTISV